MNIPKCPNCGSTAQPDLIEIKLHYSDYQQKEYFTEKYECGCGCVFRAYYPRTEQPIQKTILEIKNN